MAVDSADHDMTKYHYQADTVYGIDMKAIRYRTVCMSI